MPKVILVNPAHRSLGFSIMTPRWLYVLAEATPREMVGEPIIVDEALSPFDPTIVEPGDIVGIGITTGNCVPGYSILEKIKGRGAKIVFGGIHPTIFPDEPLIMGADSVVTGNGDIIWPQVIHDALTSNLKKKYLGGRVPGDQLLKARWKLLEPDKYIAATVQTIAGCPENCSFCSVWVTDGRKPRQRLNEKVISEVQELRQLGFRIIAFADDNFSPATLGRINREPDQNKKAEFIKIRQQRLKFFNEYAKKIPKNIHGFVQMTSETANDPEYLEALYEKMGIRGALIGVESFSSAGLKSANKQWNPVGEEMIRSIQTIEKSGIMVLSSVICGLGSDTPAALETMRDFVAKSETTLAQFTLYSPYPGTVDYNKMKSPQSKGSIRLLNDGFWLNPNRPAVLIDHPNFSNAALLKEVKRSWKNFYTIRSIISRGIKKRWRIGSIMLYLIVSLGFRNIYAKDGISSDSIRGEGIGPITSLILKKLITAYNNRGRALVKTAR